MCAAKNAILQAARMNWPTQKEAARLAAHKHSGFSDSTTENSPILLKLRVSSSHSPVRYYLRDKNITQRLELVQNSPLSFYMCVFWRYQRQNEADSSQTELQKYELGMKGSTLKLQRLWRTAIQDLIHMTTIYLERNRMKLFWHNHWIHLFTAGIMVPASTVQTDKIDWAPFRASMWNTLVCKHMVRKKMWLRPQLTEQKWRVYIIPLVDPPCELIGSDDAWPTFKF